MKIFSKTSKFTALLATTVLMVACQSGIEVKPRSSWEMADAALLDRDFYERGKSHLAAEDYGLAIDAFREDIRLNGSNAQALNGIGICFDMLGRYDISQKYYEKALALDPKSAVTFSNMAYSQYLQGEYEAAQTLAGLAEEMLMLEKETKLATVEKIVEKNKDLFKSKEEREMARAAQESAPSEEYVMEQVGERTWESVPRKKKAAHKEIPKYKGPLAIAKIIDQARRTVSENTAAAKTGTPELSKTPSASTLRIVNGTGRPQMAKRFSKFIGNNSDIAIRGLANAQNFGHETSIIKYQPGHRAEAEKLAQLLSVPAEIREADSIKTAIELTLGADLLPLDTSIFNGSVTI